jgi:hypothetical protein
MMIWTSFQQSTIVGSLDSSYLGQGWGCCSSEIILQNPKKLQDPDRFFFGNYEGQPHKKRPMNDPEEKGLIR